MQRPHTHRLSSVLTGVALVASSVLLVPATGASVGAASASAPSVAGEVAVKRALLAAASLKPTKRVRTAYGKAPIRTTPGRRYVFAFTARAGDKVKVLDVGGTSLRSLTFKGPRGARYVTGKDGFATLKRTGKYKVAFRATSSRSQMLKLKSVTSSKAFTAPARRGVQYAVDVPVGAGGRKVEVNGTLDALQAGGQYRQNPGRPWFDSRAVVAVRGMPLWGADLYPTWESESRQPVVVSKVRLFLAPGKRARLVPRTLLAMAPTLAGDAVQLPRDAAGAVLRVKGAEEHEYVSLIGADGLGRGVFDARGARLPRGGQVMRSEGAPVTVVLLNSTDAATSRSLRFLPTPVHGEEVVVGGPSVRIPADERGLDVLVRVATHSGGVRVGLDLTAAPTGVPWLVSAGDVITRGAPRGCNGCEEGNVVTTRLGTGLGFDNQAGSLATRGGGDRILLSTHGTVAEGGFELALRSAPLE